MLREIFTVERSFEHRKTKGFLKWADHDSTLGSAKLVCLLAKCVPFGQPVVVTMREPALSAAKDQDRDRSWNCSSSSLGLCYP